MWGCCFVIPSPLIPFDFIFRLVRALNPWVNLSLFQCNPQLLKSWVCISSSYLGFFDYYRHLLKTCSLLWVEIDARSIFSFPGYRHRLRHIGRFVAQQHNPGGRAILKYSTFFPRIISNLQEELTPCFGFCFFGKYSSSKASSGVRPVLLCFFFLGCVGRPFSATDFVFTIWVLFSESLRNEVKQRLYS